jgi:dual specificity phosphatase 12
MDKVSDTIYVGSLHTLSSPRDLARAGITHIVSLLRDETALRDMSRVPISTTSRSSSSDGKTIISATSATTTTPNNNLAMPTTPHFRHLHVQIDDDDEEDIIKYFAIVNAFINHAHSHRGRVLIHCIAGISRSVTVAMAYLLHETEAQTSHDIEILLAKIKRCRPIANPNVSFREQLEIYVKEGCTITANSRYYRSWLERKNLEGIPLEFEILPIPDFTPVKKFVVPYDKLTHKL